jgi:hypothetical protein
MRQEDTHITYLSLRFKAVAAHAIVSTTTRLQLQRECLTETY